MSVKGAQVLHVKYSYIVLKTIGRFLFMHAMLTLKQYALYACAKNHTGNAR